MTFVLMCLSGMCLFASIVAMANAPLFLGAGLALAGVAWSRSEREAK